MNVLWSESATRIDCLAKSSSSLLYLNVCKSLQGLNKVEEVPLKLAGSVLENKQVPQCPWYHFSGTQICFGAWSEWKKSSIKFFLYKGNISSPSNGQAVFCPVTCGAFQIIVCVLHNTTDSESYTATNTHSWITLTEDRNNDNGKETVLWATAKCNKTEMRLPCTLPPLEWPGR